MGVQKMRNDERIEIMGEESGRELYTGESRGMPLERGARPPWRRALLACVLALTPACAQLNLYSLNDDVKLGLTAYDQAIGEEKLLTSGPKFDLVRRVTDRLVAAVKESEPEIGNAFEWEVRLIDNDGVVNAFCLPGGKMAVYTGILPVAGGEAGLAVVMGHEIAHATRRHGTQAMTRGVFAGAATAALQGNATVEQIAGVTAGLTQLKFGRDAELEADRAGLTYMARAGFDPREAVAFWTRMSELSNKQEPGLIGERLSTHPSDSKRIEQIESLLPEAMQEWEGGPKGFETPTGEKSLKH
jgi:predicted Zn-dependent protease